MARLIPIKLDVLSDDAIRNALEHALLNGADVISCSLGYPQPIALSTFISGVIRRLATEGRGGKGIPIFVAAGNANPASNNQARVISDFAADPNVICVTASNSLDLRSSYSFYGPNAFLCAPTNGDTGAGITTASCDIANDQRSVMLGYTSGFGGTSSAAPLAAGICALILSVNPNLNVGQIRGILAQSCDKIGPAGTYSAQGHSPYYGFGRINALKAVQLAAAQGGAGTTAPPPAAPAAGSARKGRVTSAKLNVRKGPSTANALVATLKKGEMITLLENVNGWWKIGEGRFVIDDYVQLV
jgi:subtilisin family serine protease